MANHRDKRARLIARVCLALGVALGVVGLALIGQAPRSEGGGAAVLEASARAKLKYSRHAEQRLRQRGVSRQAVERLVADGQPFSYTHEGRLKQGYYDERTGLFAATADGVVLTVIAHATPRYVDKLKRARSSP